MATGDDAEGQRAEPAPRSRKIIHIDMDAFYASVEQRDNPELRGKPVAVGGSWERGVVAAASYEARKFGVHSAMPSVTAKRRCPDLIFVKPRFDAYKEISEQIRQIFAEYTPIIEPLSLDEAYLDVTENLKGMISATRIAEQIRATIRAETELTASAGVSYNKFLAKLASDYRKPDGLFVITPEMGPGFVETLPVRQFHGVGPATAKKMKQLGIDTGLDLRAQSPAFLQRYFGKMGSYYYWAARGIDERPVRADRIRKSIGVENTFPLICLPMKSRTTLSKRSSTKSGDIASVPVRVGVPSPSRSSLLTSGKSPAAAPAGRRSRPAPNLKRLAAHCSNLSFLLQKAFGSWVCHYPHSGQRMLDPNATPSSPCRQVTY